MPRRASLGWAISMAAVLAAGAAPAPAQVVPFGDTPVGLDGKGEALQVSRSGLADLRGKLAGQTVRARTVAASRARTALHGHVDRVMSAAQASAAAAERVHNAVDATVQDVGERLLSDGSVVVTVRVAIAALARAWPAGAEKWR